MESRIYDFERHRSSSRKREGLVAAIREITPAAKTIAEEMKRASIIRTSRMIIRNQRRESDADSSHR